MTGRPAAPTFTQQQQRHVSRVRIQSRVYKIANLERVGRICEFQFVRHASAFKYIVRIIGLCGSGVDASAPIEEGDHGCFTPIKCAVLQRGVLLFAIAGRRECSDVLQCRPRRKSPQALHHGTNRRALQDYALIARADGPVPGRWKKEKLCFSTSRDSSSSGRHCLHRSAKDGIAALPRIDAISRWQTDACAASSASIAIPGYLRGRKPLGRFEPTLGRAGSAN